MTKKKTRLPKKRDYGNDYLSVTEVLSHARKVGLEMWFKMRTKKECDELSAKAKEIGSQLHELIEASINGKNIGIKTKYPTEVQNGLNSFIKFINFMRKDATFTLKWAELQICDKEMELNGTIDCIGELEGTPVIIDWKTGECKGKEVPQIYPEYILQVAAYWKLYNLRIETKEQSASSAIIVVFAKDKEAYGVVKLDEPDLEVAFNCFWHLKQYADTLRYIEKYIKKDKTNEIRNGHEFREGKGQRCVSRRYAQGRDIDSGGKEEQSGERHVGGDVVVRGYRSDKHVHVYDDKGKEMGAKKLARSDRDV
jgi:hypothetical protein